MMWPFKKKPAPIVDARDWNEDWSVGDTAECINDADNWHPDMPPWERLPKGNQYIVVGFAEGFGNQDASKRCYFLNLEGLALGYETTSFRKVRTVKQAEETSIGEKILKAKPAPDIKRKKAAPVSDFEPEPDSQDGPTDAAWDYRGAISGARAI